MSEPVALPKAAAERLAAMLRARAEIGRQANIYVAGLREGLGVPADWTFDEGRLVFVPPVEEG